MIDPFHLEAYGVTTVNYNRDIEIFPVLNAIFEGIYGSCPYKSPTDMGVNMVGNCISDDEVCCEASRQEIIRRYYQALSRVVKDQPGSKNEVYKIELLMKQAKSSPACVLLCRLPMSWPPGGSSRGSFRASGRSIVTGKTSNLLGASAALLLNAVKELGGIPHERHLISPASIELSRN